MTIEEEIARALAEWRSGENFESWEVDMYAEAVAVLMPLFRRAQAEAWDEGYEFAYAPDEDVDNRPSWNPYTEQEAGA